MTILNKILCFLKQHDYLVNYQDSDFVGKYGIITRTCVRCGKKIVLRWSRTSFNDGTSMIHYREIVKRTK